MLAGSLAHAQSQPVSGADGWGHPAGEHHANPAIAVACAGKPIGTPVTVTFHNGKTRTIECGIRHHHHREGEGNGVGSAQ
jgi:hypothetical protein